MHFLISSKYAENSKNININHHLPLKIKRKTMLDILLLRFGNKLYIAWKEFACCLAACRTIPRCSRRTIPVNSLFPSLLHLSVLVLMFLLDLSGYSYL